MSGGSISTAGMASSGVMATGDARIGLSAMTISTAGEGSSGITMNGGELNVTDVTLTTSGQRSAGISLAYATSGSVRAVLDNVNLVMQGTDGSAGLLMGNADVQASRLTLSATGSARGVDIYNITGGRGILTLSDSLISTENGDALYLLGGEAALTNVTAETTGGMALNVNKDAGVTVRGGRFSTLSDNAFGVWLATSGSSASVSGAQFRTEGSGSHVFNAQFGNAVLSDTTLASVGDGSYGLYTEADVTGDSLYVSTAGSASAGIFAARGGSIALSNTRVITQGRNAAGLMVWPDSTVTGNAVAVGVSGDESAALRMREGSLQLSNSLLSAHGENGALLSVSGAPGEAESNVTLDNVTGSSDRYAAIVSRGAALDITLQNGTHLSGGNGVAVDLSGGSRLNLTAAGNVVLKGDLNAAAGDIARISLRDGSALSGAVRGIDSLSLSDSRWNLTDNSDITAFTNNGRVTFEPAASGFRTLTLGSLDGSGTFDLNTDIAALQGDVIDVRGKASGQHVLQIANTGREPKNTDGVLPVVKTGGGEGQFSLRDGVVDAGTWQYSLRKQGNDWVLATSPDAGGEPGEETTPPVTEPRLTPSARSSLALFNAIPVAAMGEFSTLRTRLGDIRIGKQQGGAWTQAVGNQFRVSGEHDSGFRQVQSGFTAGVDSSHQALSHLMLTGVFAGYSNSRLDFSAGSTGSVNSFFIGAYNTWLMNEGWYADAVVKASNFSSHADVRMSDGTAAKGGFSTPGFGLSLELGRQMALSDGWFAEPSLTVSSLWVRGAGLSLDNGLEARSGTVQSRQAALSMTAGRTLTLKNGTAVQPWLKVAVINEFAGSNSISINGNHFNNDLSGLRGEYGAGLSVQLTSDVYGYSDASFSTGAKIRSPVAARLGIRWSW